MTPGKSKPDTPTPQAYMSHEAADQFQSIVGISGARMKDGLAFLRSETGLQVEHNYREHMYARNRMLQDFYEYKLFNFLDNDIEAPITTGKNKAPQVPVPKHFVHSKPPIHELIDFAIYKRGDI